MEIFNLLASDIIDLELKLDGKLPINRDELLALANSWGRIRGFYISNNNIEVTINSCNEKEKYDLSNLDVSEITNFDSIFTYSYFNGDISKWNVSNATSMEYMFYRTENFNQNLNSWNISKVKDMENMFASAKKFNKPVLWDLSHVQSCYNMFFNSISFENKFNKVKILPYETNKIKNWLKDNQERMIAIEIEDSKGEALDKFILDISLQNKSFVEKMFIRLQHKIN